MCATLKVQGACREMTDSKKQNKFPSPPSLFIRDSWLSLSVSLTPGSPGFGWCTDTADDRHGDGQGS